MSDDDAGFLSRWSRRKVATREGRAPAAVAEHTRDTTAPSAPANAATAVPVPERQAVVAAAEPTSAPTASPAPAPPPPPRMEDVQTLTPASDFARFAGQDVDPAVRNAALKKLFADPRFNVIDDMDTDIMDYGKLEALPASMLRRMTQAHVLGLFKDEEAPPAATDAVPADATTATSAEAAPETATEAPPAAAPDPLPAPDEDPDLRLQPDDAAGPAGDRPRAEDPAGRER